MSFGPQPPEPPPWPEWGSPGPDQQRPGGAQQWPTAPQPWPGGTQQQPTAPQPWPGQQGHPWPGQQGQRWHGQEQYAVQAQPQPQWEPLPQPGMAYQPMVAPKSPALSVLLSVFIPGLGSMINDHVGTGVTILILNIVGIVLSLVLIGIPLAIATWIWGLVDAYQSAQRWNQAHGIIS